MLGHKVLTLTGVAQPLIEAYGETAGGKNDVACAFLSLQPGEANANPIYVGGPDVSATDYAVRLPASAAGVPPAPFPVQWGGCGGLVRLSSCYVIGTAAEKLHLLIIWA